MKYEVLFLSVFIPLKAADAPTLRPFYESQPYRLSDYTVGAAFMWRKYLQTAYVVFADMLICRITLKAGDFFTFPIGHGDLFQALQLLEEYCQRENKPLRFAGVPADAAPILTERYAGRCDAKAWRDAADYLYDYTTFLTFAGRKLSGKRNHLKRFWAANPTCVFTPITNAEIPEAVAFVRAFGQKRSKQQTMSAMETEEILRSCELIENMEALGVTVGALRKDGVIIAVAAGEIVRDMLCVHVEKADTMYEGIYQAISQAFAQYMQRETLVYINREDDAGDEGLRTSKLSYRPCALLEKFTVTVEKEG